MDLSWIVPALSGLLVGVIGAGVTYLIARKSHQLNREKWEHDKAEPVRQETLDLCERVIASLNEIQIAVLWDVDDIDVGAVVKRHNKEKVRLQIDLIVHRHRELSDAYSDAWEAYADELFATAELGEDKNPEDVETIRELSAKANKLMSKAVYEVVKLRAVTRAKPANVKKKNKPT